MQSKHVEGRQSAKILLYTLSTCGWCKKTKELLGELGVAYDYIDVDLVPGEEYQFARGEVSKWNPACSFPTIVIDGKDCLVGFQEDRLRKLLAE
jgi:glutaredoxin-like protein NrdH